jgi:sulfur-oxidizing protein SoxA
VATRYPAYSRAAAHVINLEQQVNRCRTLRQRASGFVYESKDLLALTAFISYQARGLPMNVAIDGPATQSYERGKTFFNARRGQLNLSCANWSTAVSGSLGDVPRKRNPVIFEHVIHKGAYLER